MIFVVIIAACAIIGIAVTYRKSASSKIIRLLCSLIAVFAICALVTYNELPIHVTWSRCASNDVGHLSSDILHKKSIQMNVGEDWSESYDVTDIVDGDTIKVLIGSQKETIRIIGLNTPETVDPRRPVECFGKEASQYGGGILHNKKITLVVDSTQGDRDRYGRLLRHVFLEDGTNYAEKMIRDGYGYEYTYKVPHAYQEIYRDAQDNARQAGRGLWNEQACKSLH